MANAGVKVITGLEVTPALVGELKPEAVVVATGAVPLLPRNILGIDRPLVMTAHDLLAGKATVGSKVAIIGGGLVGCECAEYVAERGVADVTILEMLRDVALDMVPFWNRIFLLERLAGYKVKIVTSAEAKEILSDSIVYTMDGKDHSIKGITNFVLAAGATPVNDLYEKLQGMVEEIYVVGDAKAPRMALEAIEEGTIIARQI